MTAAAPPSRWFARDARSRASLRLFCLPYAAGNAAVFRGWQDALGPEVDVVPVRLPGRLERVGEPAIGRADRLADELTAQLTPLLDRPFVVLGVSMGGLVAFEVTRRLVATGTPPERLVVASYRSPRRPVSSRRIHRLPDGDLVRALRELDATPPELLGNDEFVRLMLPTIRADFAVTETYEYQAGEPVPVPITVIRGHDDPFATAAAVAPWRLESSRPVELVDVPGGHFFVTERPGPLLDLLRDRLARTEAADHTGDANTSDEGDTGMTDLSNRLSALTPRQRQLLTRRLQRSEPPAPPAVARTPDRSGGELRWSLFFFASGDAGTTREQYELLLECARFADRRGFDAIWFPERHFDSFGAPYPSPAVLAGAIAGITERLRIRAGSVVLPLHDPIRVAEDWAVLDNLSGGRIGVSFASGWHPNDFALAPEAYESRKTVLMDKLDTVRRLWAREAVPRVDGAGNRISVLSHPAPLRPDIPLWLTSSSRVETWLTAAEHGMNVLTGLMEQTTDDLAGKVAAYREALHAHQRDVRDHEVTAMLHTFIGPTDDAVRSTVHAPLVRYLRSHMELFAKLAKGQDLGINLDQVTDRDKDQLAELAFERYFTTHGLFGTPDSALATVDRLRAAGVTEIACLVDFGIEPATVLDHLEHLDQLRSRSLTHAGEPARAAG